MTSPIHVLAKIWAEHCDGVIQLPPPTAELVQSIMEPRRRAEHPGWKEKLAKMKCFFYHLYITDEDKGVKAPYVTICLLVNGEDKSIARGISVCHPKDTPNKKKGRFNARIWAEKAMFYKKNIPAKPTEELVLSRLDLALMEHDDVVLMNGTDTSDFPEFGVYLEGGNGDEALVGNRVATPKELAMMVSQMKSRGSDIPATLVDLFNLFAGNKEESQDGQEASS